MITSGLQKSFLFCLLLFSSLMILLNAVVADTDGVWHQAEDIRGGVIGSDEQPDTALYRFINPVFMNQSLNMTGNDIKGVNAIESSRFVDRENSAFMLNPSGMSRLSVLTTTQIQSPDDIEFYLDRGVGNGNRQFVVLDQRDDWQFQVRENGNVHARNSLRTPIMYDSDHTYYRIDPSGTSRVNSLRIQALQNCDVLETDGSGNLICGVDKVNDADANPNNEIQDLAEVLSRGNDAGGRDIRNAGRVETDHVLTNDFGGQRWCQANSNGRILCNKANPGETINNVETRTRDRTVTCGVGRNRHPGTERQLKTCVNGECSGWVTVSSC